jgi:hypothetical protein
MKTAFCPECGKQMGFNESQNSYGWFCRNGACEYRGLSIEEIQYERKAKRLRDSSG